MASSYDFRTGLPDTSGMSNQQRLAVLRAFRHYNEEHVRKKKVDFTHGPPDLSGLEGAQRLQLLRSYRQWLDEQAKYSASAHGDDDLAAGTIVPRGPRMSGRPPPASPCWVPDEPPRLAWGAAPAPPPPDACDPAQSAADSAAPEAASDPTDSPAAGNATRVGYFDAFERTRTARPAPTNAPWLDDARLPRPTGRARAASDIHAHEDHLGSATAGITGTHSSSEVHWMATRPSSARPACHTDARVFMVDEPVDHQSYRRNAAARDQLRQRRYQAQDQALASRLGTADAYIVAGAATPRDGFGASAVLRSEPTTLQPPTVGMSAQQAGETRRAWRSALVTEAGGPVPVSPERTREAAEAAQAYAGVDTRVANGQPVAGMRSTYRPHASMRGPGEVRPGAETETGSESAAEYNLGVIRAARASVPPTPRTITAPPWCGGAEAPLHATGRAPGAAAPHLRREGVAFLLGGSGGPSEPSRNSQPCRNSNSPIAGEDTPRDASQSRREWRQQLQMAPRPDGLAG
eukprot:scaffold1357_cov97-Isochrysis_galbana.AAC.3